MKQSASLVRTLEDGGYIMMQDTPAKAATFEEVKGWITEWMSIVVDELVPLPIKQQAARNKWRLLTQIARDNEISLTEIWFLNPSTQLSPKAALLYANLKEYVNNLAKCSASYVISTSSNKTWGGQSRLKS